MTTLTEEKYTPKTWNLSGLQGISDQTLQVHFGLYEGYVKNTNLLNEQIHHMTVEGKASGVDPHFAELVRRLGFEYNGMRLHEYYFENLISSGKGEPNRGTLTTALERSFGSVETWKKQFAAIGGMRGIGWAIAYQDTRTGRISNHWVTLHEDGNLAGFEPILVMDLWEHAYLLDYRPAEKAKYVEAFFANVDWDVVASRVKAVH